jgi:hypothetical protein
MGQISVVDATCPPGDRFRDGLDRPAPPWGNARAINERRHGISFNLAGCINAGLTNYRNLRSYRSPDFSHRIAPDCFST